ncbi:MAG TPA: hypothetical protein PLP91_09130 [Plasticicumulans sp.]|nr:hypothetical protein [Plasticicumulans sp.]HNJ76017.1 hypothetical protein [Azospira sp.]HNB90535.1 hypothetical protein [Plasticicumulans sp.]HNF67196.1 hypothetical protein [Plasticicumulans sp.]HNN07303.1 hypothetical protein [Azospira sp.]
MRLQRALLTSFISLLLASGASAQLMDENLLQGMPAGYKIGFQERQGPIIITEMVPESESAEEWTEMVTSQLFIGLKSVSPETFRAESRKKWLEACKDGNFAEIASGEENGYPMALWMLSCPHSKAPGRPEITWFKAIRGQDAFYVVQKSFRFEPSNEQVQQSMRYLRQISVCDTRIPQRACPVIKPPEAEGARN